MKSKIGKSVLSNMDVTTDVLVDSIAKISKISTLYSDSQLSEDQFPQAVKALDYHLTTLSAIQNTLHAEVAGSSQFSAITSDGNSVGTVVNNLAIAIASAELCKASIQGEMGEGEDEVSLEDALDVPDEEVEEAPEGETVEESFSDEEVEDIPEDEDEMVEGALDVPELEEEVEELPEDNEEEETVVATESRHSITRNPTSVSRALFR